MKVLDKNSILFLENYLNNPSPTGYESEGQKMWMEYIKYNSRNNVLRLLRFASMSNSSII